MDLVGDPFGRGIEVELRCDTDQLRGAFPLPLPLHAILVPSLEPGPDRAPAYRADDELPDFDPVHHASPVPCGGRQGGYQEGRTTPWSHLAARPCSWRTYGPLRRRRSLSLT